MLSRIRMLLSLKKEPMNESGNWTITKLKLESWRHDTIQICNGSVYHATIYLSQPKIDMAKLMWNYYVNRV